VGQERLSKWMAVDGETSMTFEWATLTTLVGNIKKKEYSGCDTFHH
jgi:hypothetical protein